jgi:uncharacterized OB-fold protein
MDSWIAEVPGTLSGGKIEDLVLSGTKCTQCGRTYFPARKNCPRCLDERFTEQAPLSRQGILHAFSIASIAPPGYSVPHAQGYIDLCEDGPRIFSLLADYGDESHLKGGCRMEVKFVEVGKDAQDRAIVGYRFRPV